MPSFFCYFLFIMKNLVTVAAGCAVCIFLFGALAISLRAFWMVIPVGICWCGLCACGVVALLNNTNERTTRTNRTSKTNE